MSRAEPFYFGPSDRPLFGWLHDSAEPSSYGLVVCSPFGYESICAHRSLRHFCEASAQAGVPALRFDYDGTGDSAGDDRDPARLAAWVASVQQAIDALKKLTSVERIALLGVRLGAAVAAKAAVERDDVDGLIAIAPVVVGKTYLRELRALQMTLDRRDPPPGTAVESDVQEAIGFVLTAETRAAVGDLDLTKLDRPAPHVLLIDRDDLPIGNAWPDRLGSQKVVLDHRRLPGYVEMMLGPDQTRVPEQMIGAVSDWLTQRASACASGRKAAITTGEAFPRRTLLPTAGGPNVIESAEFIDAAGSLFGVLSVPESPPPSRSGLLLLNAGSVHHVGSNRLYVTLARRWAAHGHAVLRLDLSGIGDSRTREGATENVVYTDFASDEIAKATAFLKRQPGVTQVHALGLCSGGYNAFKAAVAGVDLDGVLLINPLTFFYKPDVPKEVAPHLVASEAARYARRLRSPEAWKKLLRGEVHFRSLARVVSRRAGNLLRERARNLLRGVGVRLGEDLAYELRSVVRKKITLRFLFSDGDPGISLLRVQGGPTVEKLRCRGQLTIDVIEGADHTFTPLWSHPLLIAKLADYLDRLPPRGRI